MAMNDKIEDIVVESVMNGIKGKAKVGNRFTEE